MKTHPFYSLLLMTLLLLLGEGCQRRLPTWERLDPAKNAVSFADQGDISALSEALDHELTYLERQYEKDPLQVWLIGKRQLKVATLLAAYRQFADWLRGGRDRDEIHAYLAASFDLYHLRTRSDDKGLLVTSYYVPEFQASRLCDEQFSVPLFPVPDDLKEGDKYYTRAEINEEGVLQGKVEPLACLQHAIDKLMLQVQGSGRLIFADRSQTIVGYAANNGHPFVGLGNLLIRDGLLPPTERNMQGIRNYFIEHPQELRRYERQMPRYIFFKFKEEAVGTLQLPVVPLRTIAVDPQTIPFGLLGYLKTRRPVLDEANRYHYKGTTPMELLVFSHDTGSAIVGDHIDLFWGFGSAAGESAGRMKERGTLLVLLPKD